MRVQVFSTENLSLRTGKRELLSQAPERTWRGMQVFRTNVGWFPRKRLVSRDRGLTLLPLLSAE
jgi:hypothetical protein